MTQPCISSEANALLGKAERQFGEAILDVAFAHVERDGRDLVVPDDIIEAVRVVTESKFELKLREGR